MSDVPQRITALLRAAIWEAHGRKTAVELIVARADTSQPNMALQAWSGIP